MAHACLLGRSRDRFWLCAAGQSRITPLIKFRLHLSAISANSCGLHAAAAGRAATSTASTNTRVAVQDHQQDVDMQDSTDAQQLLAVLSSTKNYTQLAAFVQHQQDVFLHSPLCVYALLHAVQLRDTLSDAQLGQGSLASEDKVLQQMDMVEQVLESLCDAAEQQVPQLPLPTQATLALALAQLNYRHQPLFEAVARAVVEQLSQKQPAEATTQQQLQQQQQEGGTAAPAKAVALCELPESLVSGVLLSLCAAYSLNGHYDEALMNELAQQAVAFRSCFPDATPLISMSAALLDLQHYHPDLVATAAAAALEQQSQGAGQEQQGVAGTEHDYSSSGLGPEAVVSLLLSLGFFKVEAPGCVDAALQAFADDLEVLTDLEPLQLSRLWKAILLLRGQGIRIPPDLMEVFRYIQSEYPDLLLLGSCKAAVDTTQLGYVQDANDVMLQEWERAGLLAPAKILSALQDMGLKLERRVQVSAAGGSLGRQQQDDEQLHAVIDVCVRLSDGKLVAVLPLDESRYCYSPPKRLRGAAAVDVLVLQALGLAVLPLPITEWQALGGDQARQRRYLEARIAAATSES